MVRSSSRAHKEISYFEQTKSDDDESEFELSDEEFVKPKKKKVKTNPPAKTTKSSGDVSKKPSVSKRAVSPAQNSKPDRLEKEDTLVIDPLSDDQEEPKMFANKSADHAPNSNMNKLESGSQSKDYSQSENKNHSDSDSDLTSIADSPSSRVGTVDTEIAPRDSSSKDSDFSDNNALSDAGDYSDDGSDYKYGDEECVVVINNAKTKKTQSSKASSSKSKSVEKNTQAKTKAKANAGSKSATLSASRKNATKPVAVSMSRASSNLTSKQISKSSGSSFSIASPKSPQQHSASKPLKSLLTIPKAPRTGLSVAVAGTARASLSQKTTSSPTLSLTSPSLSSPVRKVPGIGGLRSERGSVSLRDLLGGSTAPRAGLSRKTPLHKRPLPK